ncbi:SDR family NAD(P)-dependent oxidoreductase [Mycolicibacterium komossense]|uniref:SDR family oxidoreductase n=1 Tax=Mycolicibacterium komossense TaxID=1779 RepID=A0ABT3C8L1_9MYCO|nr:SDR family oxidoreductase [Mycolicibacterium komossense]MCV7225785.1 SDR family oxidoreductase [Mycolicibacterium komossense]
MAGRFDGKAAIVTGATSGIGRTIAARLHDEGAAVVITGRDEQRGRDVVQRLGDRARFVAADLTSAEGADTVVDTATAVFGRLDVLVNNAAVDHTGGLIDTPMAEIRETFEVNVFAAIRMLQAAARAMTESGGGAIVNITSRLATIGVPTMAIYSASKGAMRSLTRAAAVELAPKHIRVNDVAPGMTKTPLYDAWLAAQADPAQTEDDVVGAIPLGRLAHPDDVAAAVAYLASDDARYVTGATMPIDGGYTAQ